jgi:hypothetical protein
LSGGSRRGSPCQPRSATRSAAAPASGRAWSTFGPHAIGAERFLAASSGTSFAQVAGPILGKRARGLNPDKDEVAAMIGLGMPGRPIRSWSRRTEAPAGVRDRVGPNPRCSRNCSPDLPRGRGRVDTDGTALGVGPTPSAVRSQRDHRRDHAAARREQRGDERADQQRGSTHRSPSNGRSHLTTPPAPSWAECAEPVAE